MEGISPVLYHGTNTHSFLEIAKSNSFRLTPDIGTSAEQTTKIGHNSALRVGDVVKLSDEYTRGSESLSKKRYKVIELGDDGYPTIANIETGNEQGVPARYLIKDTSQEFKKRKKQIYFMSFARSKNGDYAYPALKSSTGKVMLVVDGKKLQQDGYSGAPVNYWSGFGSAKNEMEDRIYSRKSHIPNASKYIKEVHIYINTDNTDEQRNNMHKRLARQSKLWGRQNGVAVYVYTDVGNFNLLNRKEVDVKQLASKPEEHPRSFKPERKDFTGWIELLIKDNYEDLSEKGQYVLRRMRYPDDVRNLASDIKMAMDSPGRKSLDKFIKMLQQRGIHNLNDYYEVVSQKFK